MEIKLTFIFSILSLVFSAGILIGGYKIWVKDLQTLQKTVGDLVRDVSEIKGYMKGVQNGKET